MIGGALWGFVPGLLRGRLDANETIITLLLNYVGALLVNALVFGPWKDPANLGWPATVAFPAAATLPGLFGTRAHVGLVFGVVAAIGFGMLFAQKPLGPRARGAQGQRQGRPHDRSVVLRAQAMLVMSLGGALGGLAGICEVAAIQGRLQPGISVGYGLTGFLVAWLSGHNAFVAIVVSFLIGGLTAAGDSLQLYRQGARPRARPFCRACCSPPRLRSAASSQRWRRVPWLSRTLLMLGSWIAASLRSATPLLIVMLGETLTQRTGVINLGVEGEMLMGACVGFAVAATTGSPLAGFARRRDRWRRFCRPSMPASCSARKANQIGSGLAVWMIGLGLTSYFGRAFVGGQVSPFLPLGAHLAERAGRSSAPFSTRSRRPHPLALALAVIAGVGCIAPAPD